MNNPLRNQELDGLRGLAALAVVLGHCNTNASGYEVWTKSIKDLPHMSFSQIIGRFGHILFPADAAVIIFFVLSGYVLWGSMLRRGVSSVVTVVPYMINRVYRLMPVAIISAIILAFIMPASGKDVAQNALLLSSNMNGVQWSLQVELLASLFLFFAFLIAGKQWVFIVPLVAGIYFIHPYSHQFVLLFLPFLSGASLHYLPARPFRMVSLAIIAYLVLVTVDFLLQRNFFSLNVRFFTSFIVVGAVIHQKYRFLRSSIPQFLGKISYSFYLTHVAGTLVAEKLIVFLQLQAANQFETFLILIFFSLGFTLPMSWLIHVLVEKPGIAAGAGVIQSVNQWIEKKRVFLSPQRLSEKDVIAS
ncbi:acyltransferase family protein [Legionella fairfieldensis]|uniref:acyltransferase family protein n=1 Tax=Legionella fairfieldensis TaxID=45064 RepID=UPI00048C95F9|nr:acyltransferase [Legionella fairfieldensis]